MTGKRSEAERLFAEGFTPESAELAELGLKKSTLRKYYNFWKSKQTEVGFTVEIIPAPAASETVPVGTLQFRQLFDYRGFEYRVNRLFEDKVHVLLVEDHPSGSFKIERQGMYLPSDTQVIPK